MSDREIITEMMAAYALDAVDMAKNNFQQELDYSESSIQKVEKILEKFHDSFPRNFVQKLFKKPPAPEKIELVCKMFGAYVGEVIRSQLSGEWELDSEISPGRKVVSLKHGSARIWPTARVHKRIVNGAEDNVWHYFKWVTERWGAATQTKIS